MLATLIILASLILPDIQAFQSRPPSSTNRRRPEPPQTGAEATAPQLPSSLQAATIADASTYRAYLDTVDTAASASIASARYRPAYRSTKRRRVAVLVCPAQLCVASDYKTLFDNLSLHSDELNVEIADSSTAAPLCRRGWMSIAQKLHTKEFFQGNLPVKGTLQHYFDAIEQGLAQIFDAEGPDVNLCVVGHSIGGWVARAYLGGLSQPTGFSSEVHRLALERCSSFVTLGTPHVAPDDAPIDQTRGLVKKIASAPSCLPEALAEKGIDITCVCSQAITSEVKSKGVEGLLAAHSYIPFKGMQSDVKGDGIVPLDMAFLDYPAKRVVLERCSLTGKGIRHSHVVPTPWNLWDSQASSMHLPAHDYPSYVSRGVVKQWAHHIR